LPFTGAFAVAVLRICWTKRDIDKRMRSNYNDDVNKVCAW